jgi:hypothetical protein
MVAYLIGGHHSTAAGIAGLVHHVLSVDRVVHPAGGAMTAPSPGDICLRVRERREVAANDIELVLTADHESALPRWEPGAHIDVVLDASTVCQYSLCGNPEDPSAYRIAVRREAEGRGGSRLLHHAAAIGNHLRVRRPRKHFPLATATNCRFVAGGTGITLSCRWSSRSIGAATVGRSNTWPRRGRRWLTYPRSP